MWLCHENSSSIHRDLFVDDNHIIDIGIAATRGRARGVDPVHLSKVWSINLEEAQRTIEVTTQL